MKTLKKVVSLSLSFLLLFISVAYVSVNALTYYEFGDFTFRYATDESVIISDYHGDSSTMVIPDTLLDRPVTILEANAFMGDNFIEHIVFGKNFTTFGAMCFADSTALKDLVFPDTLKLIVFASFQGCTALSYVDFADSCVSIVSEDCFNKCSSLNDVRLNDNVTVIEKRAFANCPALEKIYIPSSVTSITQDAFYNSPNVTIACYAGSYALDYAIQNNLDYIILDDIDKSELKSTIDSAENILNNILIYIPETVEGFENTYNQAVNVYKDVYSTAEDVKNANDLLLNAINSAKTYKIGDSDLSGEVNIRDATIIQLYCAKLASFNDTQFKIADMDQDGIVTVKDATLIQLTLAGLI